MACSYLYCWVNLDQETTMECLCMETLHFPFNLYEDIILYYINAFSTDLFMDDTGNQRTLPRSTRIGEVCYPQPVGCLVVEAALDEIGRTGCGGSAAIVVLRALPRGGPGQAGW